MDNMLLVGVHRQTRNVQQLSEAVRPPPSSRWLFWQRSVDKTSSLRAVFMFLRGRCFGEHFGVFLQVHFFNSRMGPLYQALADPDLVFGWIAGTSLSFTRWSKLSAKGVCGHPLVKLRAPGSQLGWLGGCLILSAALIVCSDSSTEQTYLLMDQVEQLP
jgi:hypothetical protein